MIRFIKVTGDSLSPDYKEGDYVMIITVPFFYHLKRGDTIVFRQMAYGMMIKNIDYIDYNLVHVLGTHTHSVDSRQFGPIPRADIFGKVVWHIRKP